MAAALILEFDGLDSTVYEATNAKLGIDMDSGDGDWPDGLLYHAAGAKPDGWVVFEVWESKEAQQRFMEERLGAALQAGGATEPPSRVEWLELAAAHALDGAGGRV